MHKRSSNLDSLSFSRPREGKLRSKAVSSHGDLLVVTGNVASAVSLIMSNKHLVDRNN